MEGGRNGSGGFKDLYRLIILLIGLAMGQPSSAFAGAPGTWAPTGNMRETRVEHTATLLNDGRVLVWGGYAYSYVEVPELYNPSTGIFTSSGLTTGAIGAHTTTLLNDGRVLRAGGYYFDTDGITHLLQQNGEVYNPNTGTISSHAMINPREYHTATLLPDGRVLIVGGNTADLYGYLHPTHLVEVFDPNTNSFQALGSTRYVHIDHTSTLLPDGKVLIVDGTYGNNAEIFDPIAGVTVAERITRETRRGHTATRLRDGRVLIVGGLYSGYTAEVYDPATGTFAYTGPLDDVYPPLTGHVATLLTDGHVLLTSNNSSFLFDPVEMTFAPTGSMGTMRSGHTLTLLPNGRVLVTGGWGTSMAHLNTAEIYCPIGVKNGTWVPTGNMTEARGAHAATLLPDGKAFLMGGFNGQFVRTGELFDASTGLFSRVSNYMYPERSDITATLLPKGTDDFGNHDNYVLVTGGWHTTLGSLNATEVYSMDQFQFFTSPGDLNLGRSGHTATLLPDGKVLVAGGTTKTAEVYSGLTMGIFSYTGQMNEERGDHTATRLFDGRVLVTGGRNTSGILSNTAEVYDQASGTFSYTSAPMRVARRNHTATLLPNGKVLIAGGVGLLVEIYDPITRTFSDAGNLNVTRYNHTATLLPDGKVLIAGGYDYTSLTATASAEIFDPETGLSAMITPMGTPRERHTATLLPSGAVLIAGGFSNISININTAELYAFAFCPPGISSISPGSTINGATVTIYGDGFGSVQGASTVSFNGLDAGAATSWSDTRIVIKVPASATTGPVEVTVEGVTSNAAYFVVAPSADLSVTKGDAPDPVLGGSNIAYSISVSNNGPYTATGVSLTDPLPAGVTYISSTPTKGSCTLSGSTVTCNLGSLTNGEYAGAVVIVRTPAGPATLTNTVSVSATEPDPTAANNTATATTAVQAVITGVDLVESSVTNPPASVALKGSFPVTDTALNQGNVASGTSTTRYYLSMNTTKDATDKLLTGGRAVPGLGAGASSTGTTNVTVPATVPLGSYYLIACADSMLTVAESNETNNCKASTTTVQVTAPDLIVNSLTGPPAAVALKGAFPVTDTVFNQGNAASGASTTRYYLSINTTKDATDKLLTGSRAVPGLGASASSTGTVTVTVPATVALGSYYLIACADDMLAVGEGNEANNCKIWLGSTVQVTAPDLIVNSLTGPPAAVALKGAFPVTDTVLNQGNAPSGASTTRYYLSTNTTKDATDKLLTGSRAVPGLGASASSTGTVTVTVPATVALGSYYFIACADDTLTVGEGNEANNCKASTTTVQVTAPDQIVNSLTAPPPTVALKGAFPVTDTVLNQGNAPSGASTTRYYLSTNTTKDATDKLLTGSRAVPGLGAGASSTGTVTVTIPATVPIGSYYLIACADDMLTVAESNEANNCKTSATTMMVTAPDLIVSAVGNPPATVALGRSLTASDTAMNQGNSPSLVTSYTRYYLSADSVKSVTDRLLAGSRAVPALPIGMTSTGTATATIPTTVPLGSYYLIACVDDTQLVAESNETNSCKSSTTTVQVTAPDMIVSAVGNPPASAAPGGSFSAADTTDNQGNSPTLANSSTRFYLSTDVVKSSTDRLLTGAHAVPAGSPSHSASTTVTIPATTPAGAYYLIACADGTFAVAEGNEANNCRASGTTVLVGP